MNTTRTTRIAVVAVVSALLLAGAGFGSSAQATRIDAGGGTTMSDQADQPYQPEPDVYVAQRKAQMADDFVTYAADRMRAAAYRTTVGRPAPYQRCRPMPERKYVSHPPLLICTVAY